MKLPVKLIILIILIAACKKELITNTFLPDSPFEVKLGVPVTDTLDGISIKLDSVLNDSRCPEGVWCIWAGYAAARFTFAYSASSVKFVLYTNNSFRTDSVINGYKIKLLSLKPYPATDRVIKQDQYRAELQITKEK